MPLIKEAANLYLFSKELVKLNKRLRKSGRLVEKHKARHEKAKEHKKEKHKIRHSLTIKDIKESMERHNAILGRLKTHCQRFSYYLRKEHKI